MWKNYSQKKLDNKEIRTVTTNTAQAKHIPYKDTGAQTYKMKTNLYIGGPHIPEIETEET